MLPTLGEERRATYSAFMPLWGGKVLQFKAQPDHRGPRGYLSWLDDLGAQTGQMSHNGLAKLQWKADWAMRWVYFDVDYEMSGKDLIDSVKASSKICRILGGTPPLNLTYELFLDEHGAKISKSKGNGFTVEQWLRYGSVSSLMLFMFQNPRAAKKLYRDLVPQLEDQFLQLKAKEAGPDDAHWHFSTAQPSVLVSGVSYQLMLNLAVVSQATTEDQLLAYLEQNHEVPEEERQYIGRLTTLVLRYAVDAKRVGRERRRATAQEAAAFTDLADRFDAMMPAQDAEQFQYQVYEVGKAHGFQPLRQWFAALYECLLGSSDGPRFGAFTAAYGLRNTTALLRTAIEEAS
jgi:lysyl-tRNA synthetase class 1